MTDAAEHKTTSHLKSNAVTYLIGALLAAYTTVGTQNRFTGTQGEQLANRVLVIERLVEKLPPAALDARVVRMELALDQIQRDLQSTRESIIRLQEKITKRAN